MGLFGPTRYNCPANTWTRIISNAFVQMPRVFDVNISTSAGVPVDGLFRQNKSRWIFPGTPSEGKLAPTMYFERGYFNTFYSVEVCPTQPCIVEVR